MIGLKLMKQFLLLFFLPICMMGQNNGALWPDTDGVHINAHGGGILRHGKRYYWYGEHKSSNTSAALVGITCYSSTDLRHWRNEGVALSVSDSVGSDIERGCTMERPKVIYNPHTKEFVLWFHLELKGQGYGAARSAVAVSKSPTGPFRYLHSGRINPGRWPENIDTAAIALLRPENYKEWWTPQWRKAIATGLFVGRDRAGGQMARDMTLYVDKDGKAYHLYSSEDNLTLQLAELTPDYTAHTGRYWRIAPGGQNEAPTLFFSHDRYWLIASGCTGWAPNAARLFSAPTITGPWTYHGNPCRGEGAEKTFGAQGTFILQTSKHHFLFMADQWRPHRPIDARYLWLPIRFDKQTKLPYIEYQANKAGL